MEMEPHEQYNKLFSSISSSGWRVAIIDFYIL